MPAVLLRSPRGRAWVTLALASILAVSLLWGLLVFVWSLAAHTGTTKAPDSGPVSTAPRGVGRADARPVRRPAGRRRLTRRPADTLPVPLAASQPQAIDVAATPAVLTIPMPTDRAATLPTGFPHTPPGAVAQLAAIDTAAFADLDPATVASVHRAVTTRGAVPLTDWTPAVGVRAILHAIGRPAGSPEVSASWTITHAQIKGVLAGGDFVLACVLGELDAAYHSTARAGVGDCQRMVWTGDRWLIGPGAQPAPAPSTWPGSADCVRARMAGGAQCLTSRSAPSATRSVKRSAPWRRVRSTRR